MGMRLVSQVNFSLAILLTMQLAIAAAPMAKPNCTDHCGSISIPYPFGIGKDCYMEDWFEIECDNTINPPRPLLSRFNMEVFRIDLGSSAVEVESPIISSNCSGREDGMPVNLTGSPFLLSDENVFTATGCNTRALVTYNSPQLVGCDSTCLGEQNDVDWREMLPKIMRKGSDGNWLREYCSGYNCCQTIIPSLVQVFNPILQDKEGNQNKGGCKLAFIAGGSGTIFQRNKDPYVQFPMLIDWMINSSRKKDVDWETVNCFNYSDNSFNEPVFRCSCKNGYEGNPYLRCTDIDECKDPTYGQCQGILRCVNTRGSYKCVPDAKWIIIFGLCAGIIVLFVLILGARCLYKSVKKRNNIRRREKFFKRMLQQQISSSEGNVEKAKIFSLKELEKATDHFNVNRIIGQGGQGTVYKGMLADGRIVAVKKSKIVDEAKVEHFINEVVILSLINHRNVVKLLGCCLEAEVPLLIYEFVSNGTLFRYLHEQDEEFPLSWATRLQIATEISGALSYLHSAAPIPIFHRDIKSKNILLDEKYKAKVSDFGISRSIAIGQTHLTTNVQGTFGYLDPEYFQTSQFTEKSDVYSFGVVLVELLTGQEPICSAKSEEVTSLATIFIQMMENNKLYEIIDPQIIEQYSIKEEVMAVANLAKRCLNLNGKKRPTMKQATLELETIRYSHENVYVEEIWEETELDLQDVAAASSSTSVSSTTW
ncbi:hypothetical protein P3X46_010744 [Hevea brasiliensis]|uniref:Protein kinase domain-containing protein n=1 Tax=Hevea brasiliensis TaxID=3981 RepID=A0ABQ9MJA7_HEVBR|nr:wall-associated receptor kinase-like 8 [Hevea brasiliensis]KAJ9178898.1 hypothetical protein P3X46_010744 [Hevea brasiliensis]